MVVCVLCLKCNISPYDKHEGLTVNTYITETLQLTVIHGSIKITDNLFLLNFVLFVLN